MNKAAPPIPAQRRRSALEDLLTGDADLVIAEHQAQDERVLAALDGKH